MKVLILLFPLLGSASLDDNSSLLFTLLGSAPLDSNSVLLFSFVGSAHWKVIVHYYFLFPMMSQFDYRSGT